MPKRLKQFVIPAILSVLSTAFIFVFPSMAVSQTKCSTVGAIKRFDFENATFRDIEVRTVTEDCKENAGKVIMPGQKVGGNSYIGTVFRIYEAGSDRFINEFVLEESGSNFKVENCSRNGGDPINAEFQNSLTVDIEIRKVALNCEEEAFKILKPGEKFASDLNVNTVYRVYRSVSRQLLDEIVVGISKRIFKIENCSRSGTPREIYIRNGSAEDIEIRRVSEDCSEEKPALVTPGRMFENRSFSNNVYRVYGKGSGKLLEEFTVQPRISTYLVAAQENDDPRQGFLETTNLFRSGIGLPAFSLDETLTNACQWFAEFMASEDKGYPVHEVSELRKDKPFPERNTALKRLRYYGWDKKNRAYFEATILDTVPDIKRLGSHFALAWSSSNTHDAPFFDRDRTKFNRVGFGYAKAKSGDTKYYACAIFGKK
ncbi:MAG: hypothetical protein KDB79_01515 [Acidobacteria bacterium]|nr:hypothetical protein [Acidobacteriota bacterium]